jgi:4-amino-4-deoxy-L-arabinose transferase-like glycosyltransferase
MDTVTAVETAERLAERPAQTPRKRISSEAAFFIVLCGYFGIQVILRLCTSGTADLDESEQLVLTQQFHWGYGPQPPLYTWLLLPIFKIIGPGILGLALLKNLLLLGTYWFTYLNARLVTGNQVLGAVAAASLLFIPQIGWESQRDLTHTVLATTLAAGTLHVGLRLHDKRSTVLYCLLGLCCGLGLLAKYNYAGFVLALLLAALTLPSLRTVILNRGMVLALVVCAIVVLPHAIWAFQNLHDVSASMHKLKIHDSRAWYIVLLGSLKNVIVATAAYALPSIPIVGVAMLNPGNRANDAMPGREAARWILRGIAAVLAMLLLGIVWFKATGFRGRWLAPVFVGLPVALVALWQHRIGVKQARAVFVLAGAVALGVAVCFPTRIWLAEKLGRRALLNAPFEKFSEQIRAEWPRRNYFLAESFWVGGNLRIQFPNAQVLTPKLPGTWKRDSGVDCLIVRKTTPTKSAPTALGFAASLANFDAAEAKILEARLKFYQAKTMELEVCPGRLIAARPSTK